VVLLKRRHFIALVDSNRERHSIFDPLIGTLSVRSSVLDRLEIAGGLTLVRS